MARAVLVKRVSADGLIEAKDGVPLGKVYEVDLDGVLTATFFNTEKGVYHDKEMVPDAEGGYLPTELLRIES